MLLPQGSALGPYEVLSPIGAGGMGQVYRARDTRLGRTVAVKVLPPQKGAVGDFAERFRREARAISSLNHPNVCALYDVGDAVIGPDTVSYLVMELLEGETLRERMRTAMAARPALDIAVQIANGLAAAHRKGLVHRDLKPENVFVTRDGIAKILDFGLVKQPEMAEPSKETEPGMVVGTAAYMSPEQIRGNPLDARSDIFSFGIVLYEMLSGTQPFDGGSPFETMTQILHEEPEDLTTIAPDLPAGIAEIVERCLAKDPEDRFVSARDLAFSLDAIARGARSPSAGTRRRSSSKKRAIAPKRNLWWALALVALLAILITAARIINREDDDAPLATTRPLTHSGKDGSPAASPDGRLVAFVSSRDGDRRIWLEQLSDGTEVALTAGPEDGAPRFAPDGATILFTRTIAGGNSLWRVASVGGEARKVLDDAFDGDVAPDGRAIVFLRDRYDGARRLSTLCVGVPGTAQVRELAAMPNDELQFPRWSPDGEWIAVTRKPRSTTGGALLLIRVDGGAPRSISHSGPHGLFSGVAWRKDSRALVVAELESRGGAAKLLEYDLDRERFRPLLWNPHAAADAIDLLADGRILFSEELTRQNLQEISLGEASDARWLTRGTAIDRQPSFSPDGKRIVFSSDRGGNADLWELTLDTAAVRRLTDDKGVDWDPLFTPRGDVLWSSNRAGHFEIWLADGDGGGARQVSRDGADAENPSIPLDGSWIYYDSSHPQKEGLWRVHPDGTGEKLVTDGETAHPEVSADGTLVVYHRPAQKGGAAIEVVRVADGARYLVASDLRGIGAGRSRWLGSSHTIVFQGIDEQGRSGLYTQDVVFGRDTTATRRKLAGFDRETKVETFAISPDGTRAVLSRLEPASGLRIAEGVFVGR